MLQLGDGVSAPCHSWTSPTRRAAGTPLMSKLVPNLEELAAAIPAASDGLELLASFDADDLDTARVALRAVVADWEQPQTPVALDVEPEEEAFDDRDLFGASAR